MPSRASLRAERRSAPEAGDTPRAGGTGGRFRLPFKWAGGKRQLLPVLRRCYPATFQAYYEPFFGSGAVFFDLATSGRLDGRRAVLTDINPDVVGCYRAIRDSTDELVAHLESLAAGHAAGGADHYYAVRDGRFNPLRGQVLAERSERRLDYPPELAAMFIYLNRTGFNGLFRVNARGRFNVPMGRYRNPRICDPDGLKQAAVLLARPGVELACQEYGTALHAAAAGDFVYLDPPYAPLSTTARFTGYTPEGFGADHQSRLQKVVLDLAGRQCHVLLSNSTAPEIGRLYEDSAEARACGLRVHRVPARRAINSRPGLRGAVAEYLVTTSPTPI